MPIRIAALLAAALTLSAVGVRAQGAEIGVAGGLAVPVYEAAGGHSVGPHVQVYNGSPMSGRLQLRAGLGFTLLAGKKLDPSRDSTRDALPIVNLDGSVVFLPKGNGSGVYWMAGAGLYAIIGSKTSGGADALVPGISLGAGINFARGGLPLFAQVRAEVPFSTARSNTEAAPTMYLPVSIGIRFP